MKTEGEKKGSFKLQPVILSFMLSFCLVANSISAQYEVSFSPAVNYLIDCGSQEQTKLDDGRTFKSDRDSASLLSTNEDIQISVDSISSVGTSPPCPPSSLPLYHTARVFDEDSTYTFFLKKTGRLWLRLYFFPLPHPQYNLTEAVFSVQTDRYLLLHDFSLRDNNSPVFKEYLINVVDSRLSLKFKPRKDSFAFINALEIVSAPDNLISDTVTTVYPAGDYKGLSASALQVSYRVNVGGPIIFPKNDTLSRTWEADTVYNVFPEGSKNVSVKPKVVKYPQKGSTPLIAPNLVYSSAVDMKDPLIMTPNFNLTWKFTVEESFSYVIRLHFCDIVSKTLNQLYLNVYINEMVGVSSFDLSTQTKALATAFYKDFVLNASAVTNSSIVVQVSPVNLQQAMSNAILNGVEVMKMSNSADSLDGLFNVDGSYGGPRSIAMKVVACVGLAIGGVAMFLLVIICVRWHRRPPGWENTERFSSWLLPITTDHSCLSRKNSTMKSSISSFNQSKNGFSGHFPQAGAGRFFTFNELQNATQNFDDKTIIGIGGFGKVHLGTFNDGTKVAIKRGNPSSEQGINEFKTEIDMLSKLRHRHLVSLIGFCDEQSEMILVYEYMAKGPLRDHLYGSDQPCLSWKQRLEICIGAARGLHYLHTGAAESIIHRDVKTTNILLDDNFTAKVSDFGLSKAVQPKTHVSTAVKGSFGYLDPEYFRSQQLTEKSDVYSFGVVLFEVLCARQVINPSLPREQVSLAEWAMQSHRNGNLDKIIDARVASTINPESLKKFVKAAEKCLAECGVDRPGMGDVLWNLEFALQLQEASRQIDPHEHTNAMSNDLDQSERGNTSLSASHEDPDVTGVSDAPVFSQIQNLQGR